jgi:hypothetical protein
MLFGILASAVIVVCKIRFAKVCKNAFALDFDWSKAIFDARSHEWQDIFTDLFEQRLQFADTLRFFLHIASDPDTGVSSFRFVKSSVTSISRAILTFARDYPFLLAALQ